MHLVAIGGSDAGISAALRARELDPTTEVTVVVADAYPNFSICGIPYYVSGEVTHWRNLAHRTLDDLKATGMQVRLNTLATKIEVEGRQLHVVDEAGIEDQIAYDQLVVGTGAISARPPIEGLVGLMGWGQQTGCISCTPWVTPSRSCARWRRTNRRVSSSLVPATSGSRWPKD